MWGYDFTPLFLGLIAIGFVLCLIVIGIIYAIMWLFNHVQIV